MPKHKAHAIKQVDGIPDSTPWQCMMKVHNFFFVLGEPASGLLLTAINLDRFIAVAWPIVHALMIASLSFL